MKICHLRYIARWRRRRQGKKAKPIVSIDEKKRTGNLREIKDHVLALNDGMAGCKGEEMKAFQKSCDGRGQ